MSTRNLATDSYEIINQDDKCIILHLEILFLPQIIGHIGLFRFCMFVFHFI